MSRTRKLPPSAVVWAATADQDDRVERLGPFDEWKAPLVLVVVESAVVVAASCAVARLHRRPGR